MGAYRYVKTTTLVDLVWLDRDGKQHENRAAIAIYAYKPYSNWGQTAVKANREMEFQYVSPWRRAWSRKVNPWSRKVNELLLVPRLSVIGEQDKETRAVSLREAEGQAVWSTTGVAFVDDHNTPVGKVVSAKMVDR